MIGWGRLEVIPKWNVFKKRHFPVKFMGSLFMILFFGSVIFRIVIGPIPEQPKFGPPMTLEEKIESMKSKGDQ